MPRAVDTDFQALLDNPRVETHSTLDLIYSDTSSTERHWATAVLSTKGTDYEPYLKRIGDIKQSLSRATDLVKVQLKNHDNVVAADVASSLRYFHFAEAIIGRYYSADNTSLTNWSELFSGRVMQPEVTDTAVSFDVVDSLVAAGMIIGARPLTVKCPYRFKDTRTCTYSGSETTCNKLPDSAEGCRGRSNLAHFGGWFFPYAPTASAPTGTGGGDGGGGDDGGSCFTGNTLVTMADGSYRPIRHLRVGDHILCFYWDEVTKKNVITTSVVDDVYEHDVWEYFTFGFDDGTLLDVTEEHPLYVDKGAFRVAGYSRLKQKFSYLDRSIQGTYGLDKRRVTSMRWNNFPYLSGESTKVYNLNVRKYHTYFANNTAVHNEKPIN